MIESSPTSSSKLPTLLRAAAVVAVGLLVGCQSNLQVRHQDALDAEQNAYSSYEIVQHPVGRTGAADAVIEQVIHRGMLAKGYERTDAANADILVSYKVLLSGDLSALSSPSEPPDDGLNGEARYSDPQPVWDVVAYDGLPGPQLAERRNPWPAPGPSPVFDTLPAIDVSGLSKLGNRSQDKTLMVMLQEPTTLRVLWLGWATSEVDAESLFPEARAAAGEVIARVPVASGGIAYD
jgi:hypothetical protein